MRSTPDPDHEAGDTYHDFLRESQEQMDNAMGRKTQVSTYRSGDELVMRIIRKPWRWDVGNAASGE